MKNVFRSLIFILFFFGPFTVRAEEIQDFHADVVIQSDGTFRVQENIQYDFGAIEKHGIFRTIPLTKTNEKNESYIMKFSDALVKKNNTPYTFTQTNKENVITLKIGEADKTLSGEQEYTVGYTIRGGITYFSDHDELYWQITGTEWPVVIKKSTADIHLSVATDAASIRTACYTGSATSTASDCDISYKDGVVSVASQKELSSFEGLTVVVGFPKGMVAVVESVKVIPWTSTILGKIFMVLFFLALFVWFIGLPIWIVIHWFSVGRDPKPPMGEAKAWFDVPKTTSHRPLTPGEVGTLVDERADMKEITGTVIDLARRGYLKIIETKKNDFSLEKCPLPKGEHLELFEKTLYDGIFEDGNTLRLKDANIIEVVNKTKKQLYESVVKEKFFDKNPEKTRTLYTVLGVIGLCTFNIPLALAAFLFGRAMPKKTLLGSQNAVIAKSLRNFITAEDRQFAYQAKKQLFFEKFLPYAVVFGVEKIWAERFKDIKLTKPDWYDGYGNNAFTSMYLINSLHSSMQSVASAATPTSSSSGFSSGFSGGSVGGGGGGGGGGSW